MTQRLPLSDYMVKRPNQISITARYETKNFEVALPYSLYDYYRHRLGLSIRYGILTVGSDMIGPFTGMFDAYGFDVYLGIKWQIYKSCERKQAKAKRAKGGKDNCFTNF